MFAIVGLQCSISLYKHRLPIFLVRESDPTRDVASHLSCKIK